MERILARLGSSEPGLEAATIGRGLPRWILLMVLLGGELIVLAAPFDSYTHWSDETGLGGLCLALLHQVRPALVTGLLSTLFLTWPLARSEFLRALRDSDPRLRDWLPWFTAHLLLVMVLYAMTALGRTGALGTSYSSIWIILWATLAVVAFASLALAALPLQFWLGWLTGCRIALFAGMAMGFGAVLVGRFAQYLLWPLMRLNLQLVVFLLHLMGEPARASQQQHLIETSTFDVYVGVSCSGLEGIGLITAFLAAYLWFFRRQLRFPNALLLLPLGAAASWIFNGIRISLLVLLASWRPAVGIKGFHSVAGWLFFNVIACAVVWTSWRFRLFRTGDAPNVERPGGPNPAAPYLAPLLAIIAASILSDAFSGGLGVLVPVQVLAGTAALLFYYPRLRVAPSKISFLAVASGMLVFFLWIALGQSDSSADMASRSVIAVLPNTAAAGWLLLRIAGAIITVPVAEEFAFRGYLIRKLVSADFLSVASNRFTCVSFLGSSLLFGLLHRQWIVGTLAGMIFAVALYRRGVLSDAVLAHATTNGLLSAYVLATGRWSLLS